MKKSILIVITAFMLIGTACRPKYVSPLESPNVTVDEAKEYNIDFEQLRDDVMEHYSEDNPYSFVKSFSMSGDNSSKMIEFNVELFDENALDQTDKFITDFLVTTSAFAHDQDFRFNVPGENDFGNLYDVYGYEITVSCNGKELKKETVKPGDMIPHSVDVLRESDDAA